MASAFDPSVRADLLALSSARDAADAGSKRAGRQFLPEIGAGPARVSELARRWRDQDAHVTVVTAVPNRPQGVIPAEYRGRLFGGLPSRITKEVLLYPVGL